MLADAAGRLAGAGVRVRIAISDTWGASHALARLSADERAIVPVGGIPEDPGRAADLGAAAGPGHRRRSAQTGLRADPRTWRRRPSAADAAVRAALGRRLDQAFGRAAEPIEPVRPPEVIEAQQLFRRADRRARDHRSAISASWWSKLCAELEERGLGARRLDLLFGRVDNRVQAVRVGTSTDTGRQAAYRLLATRSRPSNPASASRSCGWPRRGRAVRHPKQTISSLAEEPEADVPGLIDVLANRVGEDRALPLRGGGERRPERAVRRVAAAAPASDDGWPAGWPRPARLLRPPEPIETLALLPDHPPVSVHLARHPAPGEARRRARAGVRRMVEARSPNSLPCATISRSRTTPASASGYSAPATARTPRPARSAGSFTGSSR